MADANRLQEIADRIAASMPREPKYRYFETSDGRQFFWTVEKMGGEPGSSPTAAKYASGENRPRGFRSLARINAAMAKGEMITFERVEVSYVSKRNAAKARAWRSYVARVRALIAAGRATKREIAEAARWDAASTPAETWCDR